MFVEIIQRTFFKSIYTAQRSPLNKGMFFEYNKNKSHV